MIQAGLSGRSGLIDARGDLTAATELFAPTVLRGTVTTTSGRTPYVAVGEWAIGLAALITAGAVVRGWRRPGRS